MDLRRLLNLKQDAILGLDIGSFSVKLVGLRKENRGYSVTAAGITEIEPDGDDRQRRQINTARAIRDCAASVGAQTKLAVCSVCGPEVAIRDFRFPSLPRDEAEGAIRLEAGQVCPFNIEEGAVDYQFVSDDGENAVGVLVAATNSLVKSKTLLADNASLNCVLMDVDGLALLNCLSEYNGAEADPGTAILNVGGSYTTLAIMGQNDLPFVRDIAYAGNKIIEQIATERDILAESVEAILLGRSKQDPKELGGSLERACDKLIVDVTRTLRYYTAQEKLATVERIFVCGGFALVGQFIELLRRRLPAEVALWNPFDRITCSADQRCRDLLQNNGSAMAVAAGLAMRSI